MSQLRTEGEIIAERYRVLGALGQGAFAVTYEALELATGRHVAVKETPLGSAPCSRTRAGLEHEARVLRSLHHPGVPRYADAFEHQGRAGVSFLLVQELAPGVTQWASVQRGDQLREAELAALARALLPILDYLHGLERPVIHRDVKPGNIIRGTRGRVTLVDFGAAQVCGQDEPSILSDGTPGYMAPEQIRGHATPASDLYGLGATLIVLLTGVEPVELPTRRSRIEFREHAHVSREFAAWLEALVEPEVSRRIPTAAAALARLHEITARASRRRRRTVPAMALAALAAGGVAVMWSTPEPGAPSLPTAESGAAESAASLRSQLVKP